MKLYSYIDELLDSIMVDVSPLDTRLARFAFMSLRFCCSLGE